MKKIAYAIGALCAFFAVGCNHLDVATLEDNAAINFRTSVQAPVRATEVTVANIGSFQVTAIGQGDTYFSDLQVNVAEDGTCTPAATKFWPAYSLDFFGWANPAGGTVAIAPDAQKVTGVTPAAAAAAQEDFVVAYNKGDRKSFGDTGVLMNFRHALSAVEVKALNLSDDIKISVKGVCFDNLLNKGDFTWPADVTTGEGTLPAEVWNTEGAEKVGYAIEPNDAEAIVLGKDAQSIMFGTNEWMFIPQTFAAWDVANDKTNAAKGARIGVLVQIEADGKVIYPADGFGYTFVPVAAEWLPGYKYTYVLRFCDPEGDNNHGGGFDDDGDYVINKITFTVTVDEWKVEEKPMIMD